VVATQPSLTLNNGVELPALGFGVFQTPPEVTQAATEEAIRVGYRLYSEGRVRAIGVSNFSAAHLDLFIPQVDVVPAANQVEVHPYYNQPALREVHERSGILTQAWSPLGGVYVYRSGEATKNALEDPTIAAIGAKYGKSPAQVILRWHLDDGRSAVPKSVRPDRIIENLSVFDFGLTAEERASIDALDTGVRGGPNQDEIDFLSWNRTIPD